jgi:hypothetical protein
LIQAGPSGETITYPITEIDEHTKEELRKQLAT